MKKSLVRRLYKLGNIIKLCFAPVILTAVILCGCSVLELMGQDLLGDNKGESIIESTEYETRDEYESNTADAEDLLNKEAVEEVRRTVVLSRAYHNERAWIEYYLGEQKYIASIDKNGKEAFRICAEGIADYDDFCEEYAYIQMETGELCIINKNGETIYSLSSSENGTVLAYGGGYALCTRHVSSFDSNYDVYEIYNSLGDVWSIGFNGEPRDAVYCGYGIFGIEQRGWVPSFYNADKKEWAVTAWLALNGEIYSTFYDGIMVFGVGDFEYGRSSSIYYIRDDGQWGIFEIPLGESVQNERGMGYHDGTIVLEVDDDVYCYDVATGECTAMPREISTRLDEDFSSYWDRTGLHSKEFGFRNDRIVLQLVGDDRKKYIAILDKQWNEIMPVTQYSDVIGFDGYRLVIVQDGETVVYDENGVKLFTAEEIGVKTIGEYCNEVAMVGVGLYIDREGKLLFEEITFLPDGD